MKIPEFPHLQQSLVFHISFFMQIAQSSEIPVFRVFSKSTSNLFFPLPDHRKRQDYTHGNQLHAVFSCGLTVFPAAFVKLSQRGKLIVQYLLTRA
jgi:hypothetical protein